MADTYAPTVAGAASHYDDLDSFYREIWGEHVHHGLWEEGDESDLQAAENLVRLMARMGDIRAGDRVVDVGCGYGATSRILAERLGAETIGLTISATQLAYARANNSVPGRTEYLLRDWYANGLPDASADVVLTLESLEHMPDLPGFFRECRRVLRPGGRLVGSAWMSCERPGAFSRRHLIDAITREAQIAGIRPESEFRAAIEGAGFSGYTFGDRAAQVKRTWPLCAWRTLKGLATKPRYRRFILGSRNPNRIFALTLFRIWAAYELGVQRYGVFSAAKS